jgi:hypothetical protein
MAPEQGGQNIEVERDDLSGTSPYLVRLFSGGGELDGLGQGGQLLAQF